MSLRRTVTALTVAAAAALTVAAPAGAATTAPTKCTSNTAGIKPYLSGALSRQIGQVSGTNASMIQYTGGFVTEHSWKNLEPTLGKYNFTAIDSAVAYAKSKGVGVRLRVIAGVEAPAYTKTMGGPSVQFWDHQRDVLGTMPRWWNSDVQARWQALQKALAARYDNDATVREVNISGTGMISEEPMLTMENDLIPGTSKTNGASLAAAGLTEAKRRAALDLDIAFMQNTWKKTHTTLFAHPYASFNTKVGDGLDTTKAIITNTYKRKPGHTTFGHTGYSYDVVTGAALPNALALYTWLESMKYPHSGQTQSYTGGGGIHSGVGDLTAVMDWAAQHKVLAMEMPFGWVKDPAVTSLKTVNTAMKSTTLAANQSYATSLGLCSIAM